ncbi:helicase-related protein, partial [Klebsiella pneumoniae]|uniref:helicase-related protein n=1 Tax=Klebsiella pneumoniae TaxID=573 RepID=UPI00351E5722
MERAGIRYVSVYGATRDRIDVVKRFNDQPELQVFIGQIETAGQGINLQAASYCVFLSNNYSYGDREQAESRIHRAGQTARNCTYID